MTDREIVTTRDPERLTRWWGPKGFTGTFHELEMLEVGANEQNLDRLEAELARVA